MKCQSIIFVLLLVSVSALGAEKYQPNFESLSRHEAAPEWLQDAKLGIYFHWGVYSVPAFGTEWYPCRMYIKNRSEYTHHVETYGDPTEFGYHDFVPMFKAEYFDADEWALLFKKAGARFAGPVAEHHDGFSMWDSDVNPWNAADMGPKRDIVGELAKAIRKQDMRLITTFHHAWNNLWKPEPGQSVSHYPYENLKPGQWVGYYEHVKNNFPTILEDDKRAILYGYMPREKFVKIWKDKLTEVIDQYHPDIIYFDSWLNDIPEKDRFEFAAYYLNQAQKRDQDVVIVRKQNDLPLSFSMNDHEKSREPRILPELWMTDDTLSTFSWCYTQDLKIKSNEMVLHTLIDTVSKNGVLLLNISPKADGTIPNDQRESLLALGAWLKANGEAIYATRPWIIAGEGPTAAPEDLQEAHLFMKLKYSVKDVRYTTSKDGKTVYAILMGAPKADSTMTLTAFAGRNVKVSQVSLLSGKRANWNMRDAGLSITVPSKIVIEQNATVFKINLK